jgi:CsoR family transcriptional regulator, copper-sensing transcriptional repressor
MQNDTKKTCLSRLNRIEGQVRGLAKMVEDDRYCIDVVNQVQAVIAALKKVEGEVLKDHIAHCVEHAIKSGDKKAQREKVTELVETLARARG